MATIEIIGDQDDDRTAFQLGERRQVDIGGWAVSLELTRVDTTGRQRHFIAQDADLQIQINGGDPADDEGRIRRTMDASRSVAI